jgi:hypothetical protein
LNFINTIELVSGMMASTLGAMYSGTTPEGATGVGVDVSEDVAEFEVLDETEDSDELDEAAVGTEILKELLNHESV